MNWDVDKVELSKEAKQKLLIYDVMLVIVFLGAAALLAVNMWGQVKILNLLVK